MNTLLAQANDLGSPVAATSYEGPAAAAFAGVFGLFGLLVAILMIVTIWKIFVKLGKPGWYSLIPIYNIYTIIKALNMPGWYLLLFFVPVVNLIMVIIMNVALAKAFGKGTWFGVVGLTFFPIIGMPILAFSKNTFSAPPAVASVTTAPTSSPAATPVVATEPPATPPSAPPVPTS